jgi:hypothetical protein
VTEFQKLAMQWLDAQVQLYQEKIQKRKADYLKKKWPWTEQAVADFNNRLTELAALHSSLLTELSFGRAHGTNLLNIANIIFNEAGAASHNGKVAVAYGWLNRTRGAIREPQGAEVSHYISLLERWKGLKNDVERLTFLQNFTTCLSVARQRLDDSAPTKNDPTKGATHWVSPLRLPLYKSQKDRYARTLGKATNRAFPLWARSPTDPEVEKMKKLGKLSATYDELTLPGIDPTEFLFYVGVKY